MVYIIQEIHPRDWTDVLPWSNQAGPGYTLQDEIKCYSLPYGALGVASHVLTYYTLVCLWKGRRPFIPWKQIDHGRFDVAISAVGLLVSSGLAAFTMEKCRNSWQLLVIAVWKLSMSLLSGITAVHVACLAWRSGAYEELPGGQAGTPFHGREYSYASSTSTSSATRRRRLETGKTAWWLVLYIPGMVAGLTGLTSLILQNKNNQAVVRLSIGFWCIVSAGLIVFLVLGFIACCQTRPETDTAKPNDDASITSTTKVKVKGVVTMALSGLSICCVLCIILAALYGDLALGFLSKNLVGLPSGDNAALFWSYFVAKRFSMFSL